MREADVVVVGAGPAGSATAALLAEAGHAVVLLERAREPRPKPCTEYISPGAAPILRQLGVLDALQASGDGRFLRGMELRAPNGDGHVIEYGHPGGERLHSLAVSRHVLDRLLLEAARGRGVTVHEGFRVASLLRSGAAAVPAHPGTAAATQPPAVSTATSRQSAVLGAVGIDRNGRTREFRARMVIGADGRHSTVARALRLRAHVHWPRRLGLVAHLRGVQWPEDRGQMHVSRRGYLGAAPLGDDLVSAGLVLPLPPGGVRLGPPETLFRQALHDYPALSARLASGRLVQPVQGVGPLAHAVHARAGAGFLLVGDAAGFLDPFTGEGIFRALRGATIAAVVIDRALRSPASAEPVDVGAEYEAARRVAFRAKEQLTLIIQVFVQAPALMTYAVRRLRSRPEHATLLGNVLGDLEPAERLLRPGYLWALLRP